MIILTYKKLSLLYRRLMSYLCYMLRNIKGNTYEVPVMDTETLQNLLEFRSVVGETYSFFFFFFFLTIIDSVKVLIVFLQGVLVRLLYKSKLHLKRTTELIGVELRKITYDKRQTKGMQKSWFLSGHGVSSVKKIS